MRMSDSSVGGFIMPSGRPGEEKKYYGADGWISYVDEDGGRFVSSDDAEKVRELRRLGYTFNFLPIPFSDPKVTLVDKKDLSIIAEMRTKAGLALEQMNNALRERARSLREVPGTWMRVDGTEVRGEPDDDFTIPIRQGKPDEIGRFDYNSRSISYYDAEGNKFLAPFSQDRKRSLQDAGYRKGHIGLLPMSDDQQEFLDPDKKEQWKKMLTTI